MNRVLVKFHWDCGRMGHLDGLFITTREALRTIIGTEIYFGEVLGKHSEIFGVLGEDDCDILCEDQEFIEKLRGYVGHNTLSGHNPFDYMDE